VYLALLANRQWMYRLGEMLLLFCYQATIMEIKIDSTASDQRFDRFLRKWFKKYPQVRLADIYTIIRK